jgi:hypothetical protein
VRKQAKDKDEDEDEDGGGGRLNNAMYYIEEIGPQGSRSDFSGCERHIRSAICLQQGGHFRFRSEDVSSSAHIYPTQHRTQTGTKNDPHSPSKDVYISTTCTYYVQMASLRFHFEGHGIWEWVLKAMPPPSFERCAHVSHSQADLLRLRVLHTHTPHPLRGSSFHWAAKKKAASIHNLCEYVSLYINGPQRLCWELCGRSIQVPDTAWKLLAWASVAEVRQYQ